MKEIETKIQEINKELNIYWKIIKNATLFIVGISFYVMMIPTIIKLIETSLVFRIVIILLLCYILNIIYLVIKKIRLIFVLNEKQKKEKQEV